MHIGSDVIFEGFLAAVGGLLTILIGIIAWNNRMRYKDLDERLTKVEKRLSDRITEVDKRMDERVAKLEKRMNESVPASITELKTQITAIEGSIAEMNTKVNLISESVISRVDKMENNMPKLMESVMCQVMFRRGTGMYMPPATPEESQLS